MADDLSMEQDYYLLKVIKDLKRQLFVISEDFNILAANNWSNPENASFEDIKGKKCYKALFNEKEPCETCPAVSVKETNKPALRNVNNDNYKATCLYAYPTDDSKPDKQAIVVLDFHLGAFGIPKEQSVASDAFLRNLISSAVDGIIAADMKGKVIIFNRAATKITGYSKKQAMETLNIRNIYPPGDSKEIMRMLRSEKYGGRGILKPYKQTCLRKDGTTAPINLTASTVYEGEKEMATIGFFHDLTETIRMEKELKKTQTQLLQAEKMSSLGQLSAGVAHQLNNPLGGITLFSQLMLEEHDLSESAITDIKRIKKEAERCRLIVKELLEFARQTKKEIKPYDINELIQRTLFLLQNQSLFQNIEIITDFTENSTEAYADVQQLNHVFMNIILNAADAMEGTGILTITTSFIQKNSNILIEISDTGPGFKDDVLNSIFDPFFTTKEEGKGTGLGLSMAYGIIENHNGKLSADNNNDGGATFFIELPTKQNNN
jgi:two-component system, NtrC family, sensor kinase